MTKQIEGIQSQQKEYTGTIVLGASTPSIDLETEIDQTYPTDHITEADIHKAAAAFTGEITQTPPIYSAVKIEGKRAYDIARKGGDAEIKSRQVQVYEFEITQIEMPNVHFRIACSKGTYIRTIADDLGQILGCGGHIIALRRLRAGAFSIEESVTLEALAAAKEAGGLDAIDAHLMPMDKAVDVLPAVQLPSFTAKFLKNGQPVQVRHAPAEGLVRLYEEGEFIGDSEDTAPMLASIPKQDDPELAREYEKYMHENHHYAPDELRIKSRNGTFSIGGDRESLRLMDADVQLIRSIAQVQPRTIVVIVAGSAVVMSEWIHEVPVALMGWYSGSNGGRALANVLSGAVNPSGRLPFVIPHDESHLPFFDRNAKAITYDYWHGQWKLDRDGNKAMFPFGFGCSYTTFSYSDVSVAIEKVVKVRCVVRNTGAHNGATVVQVYAGRNESAIERPLRRLVAFKRVDVAAGETVQVECEIPFQRFATRDVQSHSWFVEGGTWNCEVAQFSGDSQSLSASIQVPERIEL